MIRHVLLDTGPLVALLDRRDRFHGWAVTQAAHLPYPLLTCEAVLTESTYLLRRVPNAIAAVLEMIAAGRITIPFRLAAEASAVRKLALRYANVPMKLADACLVRMAEQYPDAKVFTLDADFRIYRKHGRQVVPTIIPNDL